MAELLTVEHFAPAVGQSFAVVAEGTDGLALELVEARGLGRAFDDREAFTLLFRGPADPLLAQATWRLVHDRIGEVDIFLVPLARSEHDATYEANFT